MAEREGCENRGNLFFFFVIFSETHRDFFTPGLGNMALPQQPHLVDLFHRFIVFAGMGFFLSNRGPTEDV